MKPSRFAPCLSSGAHTPIGLSSDFTQSDGMFQLHQRRLDRECPPARIKAEVAADFLGFHTDDLAILARHEILVPLGNPAPNAVKYYATTDVAALSENRDLLDKATQLIYERNRQKA
jgi:hypothetical protein